MIAASTSVAKAADWRSQNAPTVPLPYWQDVAPGLGGVEGGAVGVDVGAIDGCVAGGVVGVSDPPQATPRATRPAAAAARP
jgi:hypothetical protein